MATGPDHYREAERLLDQAHHYIYGDGADPVTGAALASEAIGHALLANAAATALNDHAPDNGGMPLEDYNAWVNTAAVWKPRRRGGDD
ncbi:hypothetical protein LZP81_30925 [Streptomyces parvulus]|uniref:hypothetical protein n=1 Tax=Streptomyces parvulus TaxID=146923 RepID=UPI001E3B12D4|nr:hypothetical protein [Streptomyces parvulus]MCC9154881.1 hypothetical protein [Streptomyces parvulus]MCE7691274.1 hypothetical protein [Streptomyces parvulus]